MRSVSSSTSRSGFTIIEVMVAILLLSTSLVAIFGAQFGAVSSASYARNITQATGLARCRMSELELSFTKDGFQEGNIEESGDCCEYLEGMQETEFTCRWEVETVVLPSMIDMMGAGEDTDGGSGMGGLGSMMGGASSGLDPASGVDDPMSSMGGLDGVIEQVLPMVTELLQQAIRRVTVTVEWQQGVSTKKFELIQYVTNPTQGPLELMQQAGAMQGVIDELNANGGISNQGGNNQGQGN